MIDRSTKTLLIALSLCSSSPLFAQTPQPSLPVREITVFKDGHAFVLQQGKVRIGNDGTATLLNLPNPVLGTFWPYSADKSLPLRAVVAGRQTIKQERDAATTAEFLLANVHSRVRIERTLNDPKPLEGVVMSVSAPKPQPIEGTGGGYITGNLNSGGFNFSSSSGVTVLLQTSEGIIPLPVLQISSLLLPTDAKTRISESIDQATLSLKFGEGAAGKDADVGMMYLQKGLRWIPNYKLSLDGKGTASVALQATLINDLIDFSDTSLNLVVGVPTFAFKDTPDPIGMQDVIAQLSRYFSSDSPMGNNFSNAIMTQSRMGERVAPGSSAASVPEFSNAERSEDLFLFALKNVSLKKGERMTLPVTQFSIPYKDVFRLELTPSVPRPLEYGAPQDRALVRLLENPSVIHYLRLKNNSAFPLTTAPALLMRGEHVLAQNMMTYTATGGESDLQLTNAVEIAAKQEDTEVKRTPNAVRFGNNSFAQIDLQGKITLTSYRKEVSEIEVIRYTIGEVSEADSGGTITALDPFNEPAEIQTFRSQNSDLSRYNKVSKVVWKVSVPPGKTITLTYRWNYFFR